MDTDELFDDLQPMDGDNVPVYVSCPPPPNSNEEHVSSHVAPELMPEFLEFKKSPLGSELHGRPKLGDFAPQQNWTQAAMSLWLDEVDDDLSNSKQQELFNVLHDFRFDSADLPAAPKTLLDRLNRFLPLPTICMHSGVFRVTQTLLCSGTKPC